MKNHGSSKTISLLGLLCFLTLACSGLASAQRVERLDQTPVGTQVPVGTKYRTEVNQEQLSTPIGTVVPVGEGFRVDLNEEQLSRVYPQFAASQTIARGARPVSQGEFRRSVVDDSLRKLKTLFPTGLPGGSQGQNKIKITVTIKLTKPPEVGLSIEW